MTDETMDADHVNDIKEEATTEVKSILEKLESDYPGIGEGLSALLGATSGGAISFTALSSLGVAGLSGAGVTSGLAAAGTLIGGGMVAGIAVLAAPVAVLAIGGYWFASRRKKAKLTAALSTAIRKLYAIQDRLMRNAEYFKEELAGIKTTIDFLSNRQNKPSA